jgi:beta-glucanase (GH16 family)
MTQAESCALKPCFRAKETLPTRRRWRVVVLHAAALTAIATTAVIPKASAKSVTFDENFKIFTWSPDGSKGWMTTFPYAGESARTLPNNHEAEYYSDSTVGVNPFSVNSGILTITAAPAAQPNPYNLPYTSGLITTYKSFHQTYGLFEIRAKLPAGQGLWPAFWLLPSDDKYTAELDAFEVLGSNPSQLFATVHGYYGTLWGVVSQMEQVANTSDGFHVYGVDWEPQTVTFLMDGNVIATAPTPTSMNKPMFMLINVAVGGAGSWPGEPNGSTPWPATMQVDWVRAYATAHTKDIGGKRAITH